LATLAALLAVTLAACGPPSLPAFANPPPFDAGPDAGPADAGDEDAGP
jgi:hypothetical protein